jgi:hypothetical protein
MDPIMRAVRPTFAVVAVSITSTIAIAGDEVAMRQNTMLSLPDCRSACNVDPLMECAPGAGQDQAAGLTVCRAWWSSNWAGLR